MANWSFLAWIALVPLMLSLEGKSRGESFRLGYFCGILFFGLTVYWFIFVTVLGAILAVAYLALYLGLFGLGYYWLSKKKFLVQIVLIPSFWVVLEYIRGHLFTGFNWVSLGYSQYQNLGLIQIADITGFYGVSFLIVMVNVFLKEIFLFSFKRSSLVSRKELLNALVVVVVAIALSVGYSFYKLQKDFSGPKMRVGVVQGNVPHERKWHPKAWPLILRDYIALSGRLSQEKVDLIVWPESSYPGFFGQDAEITKAFKAFLLETKTPYLIGMITQEGGNYFNSAVFFSSAGRSGTTYHKRHLVPFGEFIPFRKQFPFLAAMIPLDDFTKGKEYVLFEAPLEQAREGKFFYSTLICFEDTVPELVRGCVQQGAGLLINMSNDAWFGDTGEPFVHLQAAVFRSIENRRFMVRCGNVGVSGFIDPLGRILGEVKNAQGKRTYVEGVAAQDVAFVSVKTLYTKFGDFFVYFCISAILLSVVLQITQYQKRRRRT